MMRDIREFETELVNGAYRMYSPALFMEGFGAAVLGGVLTVAGLGTPISIGGAALAAEGAGAMAVGAMDAS